MCVAGGCVSVSEDAQRLQKGLGSLTYRSLEHLVWVLGIELRCSALGYKHALYQ